MKLFKRIMIPAVAIMLAIIAVIAVSADTIYDYYGYSYVIVDNTSLSLVGWDNRSPELIVPNIINGRNIISVANGSFSGNNVITSVDFTQAKSFKRIGSYAFENCTALNTDLVLPETITRIDNRAFQGCESLPSVTVNANVSEIPNQCFYQCSSLTTATLNENIQRIGYYAFADCTNLEYVEIPKSVTEIGTSSFQNDPNLTLGVWYGSYGYEYAKAQSIPYILLDNAILGDANGDGSVNINDVTAIQRFKADMEVIEGINLHAADVNGDGDVTIEDATILQRFFAEYDDIPYSIGEVITQ